MKLLGRPVSHREANAFVLLHHRHHGATRGCKFVVGVGCYSELRGVAIVGRPVARNLDDGETVEVTRLCTDGTKNLCSMLYGRAKRIAREMGFKRLITYTLEEEGGASLRASGFTLAAETKGGSWSRKDRPRTDKHPTEPKLRWEINL